MTPSKQLSVRERAREMFDEKFGSLNELGYGLDNVIKDFIDQIITLAQEEREKNELDDWKDSYKGKFWSTAVEKCFKAPFVEVAIQYLLKRIDEKNQDEIKKAVQREREEKIKLFEEYFEGLMVIPHPELTKENLLKILKQ